MCVNGMILPHSVKKCAAEYVNCLHQPKIRPLLFFPGHSWQHSGRTKALCANWAQGKTRHLTALREELGFEFKRETKPKYI